MEIRNIYLCKHSFLYGTFTCASTNYLDRQRTAHQHILHGRLGLSLTMAEVVLPTRHERKGSKIKEKEGREREAEQNESEVQKKE